MCMRRSQEAHLWLPGLREKTITVSILEVGYSNKGSPPVRVVLLVTSAAPISFSTQTAFWIEP